MRAKILKRCSVIVLAIALCLALLPMGLQLSAEAAEGNYTYNELYRNQLAFSPAKNWNNDPNGLLYVNGTYHMYYQYNPNGTGWGDISWGHATSTDLVHWAEQTVALPVNTQGYAMMFSGSAVYDENNTSGLFEVDEGTGKVKDRQGIVAILTQPSDAAGGQRQILAYSKDNGNSFAIYGEILGAADDGGLGDGEFRDPKVFWEPVLGKWLMAVGGGSVRMYSSDNLIDWSYLGETGYWGECPDLSAFTVNGERKYVLILSPEDKEKSHQYNETTRYDTYYPAEYYVVGELDENGLFVGETSLRRLSQGIDSYAFQSFNNAPGGKVYGVSWAASWKTVGEYAALREVYNGGMTVVCELGLTEQDGEYVLTRYPVGSYDALRGNTVKSYDGTLEAGADALEGAEATVADLTITLDFSAGDASEAELVLRSSEAERLVLRYDADTETLTLDRSDSSLAAQNTSLFAVPYTAHVPLQEGKTLTLRILLDRAFVNVFANGGQASFFSAFFPSVSAQGMSLTADGALKVKAYVYEMRSIFGESLPANGELYLSTDKIDSTVGSVVAVSASMLTEGFTNAAAEYQVESGSDVVSIEKKADATYVTMLKKGYAAIRVSAGGKEKRIAVYVYENGFESDLAYTMRWGGFSLIAEDGLHLSTGTSDAFYFSDTFAQDFAYSATFTPKGGAMQAAALVFAAAENYTGYYVVTADSVDDVLKLWRSGTGDVASVPYSFAEGEAVTLRITMNGALLDVYVNGSFKPSLTYRLEDYEGGLLGLNVYNGEFAINNVRYSDLSEGDGNSFALGNVTIESILNTGDCNAILSSDDYTFENGVLTIAESYLLTLRGGESYTFKVNTSDGPLYVTAETSFSAVSLSGPESYDFTEDLSMRLGRDTTVSRVLLNGKEVSFVQDGRELIVSASQLDSFADGRYTVTVYSSNGRAETSLTLLRPDTAAQENSKLVSIVVICAVAVLAAGGAVGYVVLVRRKKKNDPAAG